MKKFTVLAIMIFVVSCSHGSNKSSAHDDLFMSCDTLMSSLFGGHCHDKK